VLLGVDTPRTHERLRVLLAAYQRTYPNGYRFDYPATAHTRHDRRLALLFPLLLRRQTRYRRRDRFLLSGSATRLNRYLVRRQHAALPRFVDTRGMPSDVLLR